MELNQYQEKAMTTCLPSSNNFAYMFYGLLGEVAELIEKVREYYHDPDLYNAQLKLEEFGRIAKKIRKEPDSKLAKIYSNINLHVSAIKDGNIDGIVGELGDIEWMLNGLMTVLGLSSEAVHQHNLDKLASRKERGKIDGNGDNR